MPALPLVALLVACHAQDTADVVSFIAPADQQSDLPLDMPLYVHTGPVEIPPDYDVLPMIHVYDIEAETEITGRVVVMQGDGVSFLPDDHWKRGRRYAWKVEPPTSVPHGPELGFPETLLGTAVFSTADDLTVVGAAIERTQEPCFIFSQPVGDLDLSTIELVVNGDPVALTDVRLAGTAHWRDPYSLFAEDPGIDVVCMTTEHVVAADIPVQLRWGGDHEWTGTLHKERPGEIVKTLRRATGRIQTFGGDDVPVGPGDTDTDGGIGDTDTDSGGADTDTDTGAVDTDTDVPTDTDTDVPTDTDTDVPTDTDTDVPTDTGSSPPAP